MDVATWTAVRRAFAEIHEAEPAERARLLAALDSELRPEVESLLTSLEESPGFLEVPESKPAALGSYRILEEIGRGGMGVVYRAERNDREFSQQVAIKLATGRIVSPEAGRRFIRERQILADLNHPNIVRLLDGGIARGQRFLVMELIDGAPLTQHVRGLPMAQRLRLFCDLCEAITHAHRHLILHRDLKPSNILVTREGAVKVLDFGIAQILTDAAASAVTQSAPQPVSLASASPEQLRGEPLTLASDVYSLGVLLYEVATGVHPQQRPTPEAIYHAVLQEAPPAPCKLVPSLGKDFNAVALKALAKDPKQRYSSVADLQADVERYQAGRPVLAVPPSLTYLAGRFVLRNRALAATGLALVLAIVVGVGSAVRQQRLEEERLTEARKLIKTVIVDLQPKMAAIPATLELRRQLITGTMQYLEAVSQTAGNDVALLQDLANSYLEQARILGNPIEANLGRPGDAAAAYGKADQLLDRALALAPTDKGVVQDAAYFYASLAEFESQRGLSDARHHAERAVTLAEGLLQRQAGDLTARKRLGFGLQSLGLALPKSEWQRRLAAFERSSSLWAGVAAEQPGMDAYLAMVDRCQRRIAEILGEQNQLAEGFRHMREASRISQLLLSRQPEDQERLFDVATDAAVMAQLYEGSGARAQAVEYRRSSIEAHQKILQASPNNMRAIERNGQAARDYAEALRLAGRPVEAARQARAALEYYGRMEQAGQLPEARRPSFAFAWKILGAIEADLHHAAASCSAYRTSLQRFQSVTPLPSEWNAVVGEARQAIKGCGN